MLKYLFFTAATAIVNLVLVSTNTVQIANAAIDSAPSTLPISQDKLITKDAETTQKPAHLNAQQQSDVKNIHRTLSEFYRGFNQYSVNQMERAAVPSGDEGKERLRGMFAELKAARVDMSIEVQNIELVSLSERNAMVRIDQLTKFRSPKGAGSVQHSVSLALVKDRGQWKISDGNIVMQGINRDR
jgi:hypothetical protein